MPITLEPILLNTIHGEEWKCNVLTISYLKVRDGEMGTRVYFRSGFCRVVVQSPAQIRAAAAAVIPDDYDGKQRLLAKLEVHT